MLRSLMFINQLEGLRLHHDVNLIYKKINEACKTLVLHIELWKLQTTYGQMEDDRLNITS
jgi:hypothetical protein